MSQPRFVLLTLLGALLILALAGGLAWSNLEFARNAGGGADFAVLWNGARAIVMEGVSPYDAQTTLRTQEMVYGHAAAAGQPPLEVDIPLYFLALLLPLGAIADPLLARAVWMVILEAALAGLTILGLRILRWRLPWIAAAALILFGIFWVYAFLPLFQAGSIILIGLLMVGILAALDSHIDELAGAFIFVAFFRFEISLPFITFILIWTLAHKRFRILGGIGMAAVILLVVCVLLLPSWFWPFLRAVSANLNASASLTPARLFEGLWPGIGLRLGRWMSVVTVLVLFVEWRAARARDFRTMLWTACLTIAATPLLGFAFSAANLAALYFPVLYLLAVMQERWPQIGPWLIAATLSILFLGLWAILIVNGPTSSGLLLWPPIALVLGLYWNRWWALRPPRPWLDEAGNREMG